MRPLRIGFSRQLSFLRPLARRVNVGMLRALEAATLRITRRRWKIDRFNPLIKRDVQETVRNLRNTGARTVVGIPFHKESGNLRALVAQLQQDLESLGQNAAIVIVGERKTRQLLFESPLPPSSGSVAVVRFAKPHGFGQKPGLSRRSWSHWAILQIAAQCRADVVFIDADVRNSAGWVQRYLDTLRDREAMVVVANYVRQFARDDAIVHIWDSLIFGALFRKWVAFRHGGDYAISREFVPRIANDQTVMRERSYTMDSAVIARAASSGARIETVWLGTKEHEPILPANLFQRLPDLVRSVFDDVSAHLPALLRLPLAQATPVDPSATSRSLMMRDLIGPDFRRELRSDMRTRFQLHAVGIRRTLGTIKFGAIEAGMYAHHTEPAVFPPGIWAKATLRFLTRYIRRNEAVIRNGLVNEYVPILELGVLGFLDRTFELTYEDSLRLLEQEYLPAFQDIWNGLSRRLAVYRMAALRRWPQTLIMRPFRL